MNEKDNIATTNTGTSEATGGNGYSHSYSDKPKSYGWICPICGTVNAPWKPTCDCSKDYAYAFQGEPLWPLNKKGQNIDMGFMCQPLQIVLKAQRRVNKIGKRERQRLKSKD